MVRIHPRAHRRGGAAIAGGDGARGDEPRIGELLLHGPLGHGRTDVMDKFAAVQPTSDDPGLGKLVSIAARREQGVSLAVITGQPDQEQAQVVGAVRGRFQMVTMVQLGEKFGRPAMALSGVLTIAGDTSEDLVRQWKSKVGS